MRPSYLSPTQCSVAEFNVDFVRKRKLDDVESIACAEYAASRTKAQPSALKFEAHASGAGAVHKGLKIVPMKGKQLAALQASKAEGVLQREAVPPILPAAWRPCRRRTKAPLQPQPPNDMSGRRAAPCREIPSHPMLKSSDEPPKRSGTRARSAAMLAVLFAFVLSFDSELDESLLKGFFKYRGYASQTSPGAEAVASHWASRGNYQQSATLLELAAHPASGTTPAQQRGRRHVNSRLSLIEASISLESKSVFEVGSNLGMNMLELREQLRWGVGVDVNPLAVNQANMQARVLGAASRFSYYVYDLNVEPEAMLRSLLPGGAADVVFMFSVNAYLANFSSVVATLRSIANAPAVHTVAPHAGRAS